MAERKIQIFARWVDAEIGDDDFEMGTIYLDRPEDFGRLFAQFAAAVAAEYSEYLSEPIREKDGA